MTPAPYDTAAIEALCKRSAKAWGEAAIQHSTLREAYRWTMPERYAEMTGGGQTQSSAFNHIFDPVGMQALDDGASQIAEALHPWDQEWIRWVPRADIPEDQREAIEQAAEQISNVCMSLINRSNFDGAAPVAHKEFLLGTGFLLIDRDMADPGRIRCTATPAYRWAIEADVAGRIQAAFMKMPIRARDAEHTIPGNWSAEARQLAEKQPDQAIDVEMAIVWLPDLRRWRVCFFETKAKNEIYAAVSRTSPLIVYRSNLTAGRAWGTGPALKATPDIKVANKVVELTLQAAAMAITGVYMADDDGILNPNTVRLVPGMVIPVAQGSNGLRPVQSGRDFDVSHMVLEDLRVNIRRALYVTRVEEREMTAMEYSGRLQQQMREQRGTYGQLKSEFAEPVMLRVLDLAVEIGLLQGSDFDKIAQIELTGPLAQDVRGAAVDRCKQAVMDIAGMVGPEVAMASVKIEKLVPWIAQRRHVELDLFRTEGELKQLAAQIAQQAAAVQAQQLAGSAPQQPQPQQVMQ